MRRGVAFVLTELTQAEELPATPEYLEIDEWRSRTLAKVMLFAFPLAVLTGIPYAYFAFERGPTLTTVALIPSIIAVILATVIQRPYRIRALCLLVVPYWLGMTSMFMHGTTSLFYLLAFVMGVVVLMGPGYAYGAIALCAITLMVGGHYTHWHPTLAGILPDPFITWSVITINFVSVATVIAVGCGNLLRKVEYSLKAQKIAAESVDLRQREITRLKNELRRLNIELAKQKPPLA